MLKWQEVHPQPEGYNFDPADRFVAFGEKNSMFIVGHNLVWHNQTPSWVFEGDSAKPLDREALLKRMRSHIQTVVGRYKGRINAWDVVNEAIEDNGSLRKSKWQQIIGDDYIEKAFQFAHEADPKAELYYNDYNEWKPEKIQGIKTLVKQLKSKNIRIDGVGLQGHWGLEYPSTQEIENLFAEYGDLGVKIMITELDVTVLPDASRAAGADIYAKGRDAKRTRSVSRRASRQPAKTFGRPLCGAFSTVCEARGQAGSRNILGRTRRPFLAERLARARPETLPASLRSAATAEAGFRCCHSNCRLAIAERLACRKAPPRAESYRHAD